MEMKNHKNFGEACDDREIIEAAKRLGCASVTIQKIKSHIEKGFKILLGNDFRLANRPKWSGSQTIKLADTNSKNHGRCIRTVWAVK